MAPYPSINIETDVYTVSEITAQLKQFIAGRFRNIRIEGEVSNAKFYPSGHMYFTLKDDGAMIKAVVFGYHSRLPGKPLVKEGDTVVCEGKIDVYEKRGEYQFIVSDLSIRSDQGNLYLKFLALKEKLAKEGLFDEEKKKPLPLFPRKIGIVTSPAGAAIRDMLRIIYGKFTNVAVQIYSVKVQGEEASYEIAEGIDYFNEAEDKVDVLIVGRGGGSLEDLAPFNEERVARAVHASGIPVISAVGHEIDFTICDFAADVRAPTPTAAAEMVVRNKQEVEDVIASLKQGLMQGMGNRLERSKFLFYQAATELKERKVDFFTSQSIYLDDLLGSLTRSFSDFLKERRKTMHVLSQRIADLNPENILKRGYSITQRKGSEEIVFDSAGISIDENLTIRFQKGSADVTVTAKQK